MKLVARYFLIVLSLTITAFSQAAALPQTFNNVYISSALGFTVTVTHELKQLDNGTQELRFKAASWFGSIEETSISRWDEENSRVVPLHYRYKRRGVGRNRDAELTFDWDKNTVTNNVQNTTWKMGITHNVQDKLSYQLQLQQDLIDGKKKFVYQIADGGHLKDYAFEIVSEEKLTTPLGQVDTVKVKRSRDNDKRTTYVWLAKNWNYLVVSMEQEEKGKSYNIDVSKATVNGEVITKF
jgi:hypothetical protein